MSSPLLLTAIILTVTLAGVLHVLIIRMNMLSSLTIPLDCGVTIRGKRLFGDHKTWRGLIVMTGASALLFAAFSAVMGGVFGWNTAIQGALLGLGYAVAELPNSFLKRQLGINDGRVRKGVGALFQYAVDQMDSVIGVTIVAAVLYSLSWQSIMILVISGTIIHVIVDTVSHVLGWKKRTGAMKRYILSQIFVFCCCKIIFRLMNTTTVQGTEHLDSIDGQTPIIMAANHRNRFDSFLLAGAMPWKYFRRLLPHRYMTAAKYMEEPGLGKFLLFCGSYSTAVENETKTHYRSKDMLRRGETILMYPEGCMTEPLEGPQKGRVGVCWIARGVENTHILPVKIESHLKVPINAIFHGGQRFTVTFGKMYRPVLFGDDLQPQVNELMDTIYALT